VSNIFLKDCSLIIRWNNDRKTLLPQRLHDTKI
jgi:hypothetical protein